MDPLMVVSDGVKQIRVGLALYANVAATFNHSCDPNTFTVDLGKVEKKKGRNFLKCQNVFKTLTWKNCCLFR